MINTKIPREYQIYLMVEDNFAHFYANNCIYKCDFDLIIQQITPINFPYELSIGIQNFPVFNHDYPQLFITHKINGKNFGMVGKNLYSFESNQVTKLNQLPKINDGVQNNRISVVKDKMYVTDGISLYQYIITTNQFVLIELVNQTQLQRLKLHSVSNNLIIRVPGSDMFLYNFGQVCSVNKHIEYDELLCECQDYIIFQLLKTVQIVIFKGQQMEIISLQTTSTKDFNTFKVSNNGWKSIKHDFIMQQITNYDNQQLRVVESLLKRYENIKKQSCYKIKQEDILSENELNLLDTEFLQVFSKFIEYQNDFDIKCYISVLALHDQFEKLNNIMKYYSLTNFSFSQCVNFETKYCLFKTVKMDRETKINYFKHFGVDLGFNLTIDDFIADIQTNHFVKLDKQIQLLNTRAKQKILAHAMYYNCTEYVQAILELKIKNLVNQEFLEQTKSYLYTDTNENILEMLQKYQLECGEVPILPFYVQSAKKTQIPNCLLNDLNKKLPSGETSLIMAIKAGTFEKFFDVLKVEENIGIVEDGVYFSTFILALEFCPQSAWILRHQKQWFLDKSPMMMYKKKCQDYDDFGIEQHFYTTQKQNCEAQPFQWTGKQIHSVTGLSLRSKSSNRSLFTLHENYFSSCFDRDLQFQLQVSLELRYEWKEK